jgi:hypothetical protein
MAAEPRPSKPRFSEPPGFAALAKRISAWTTNALLTLIVLVAGLGFGRQVLQWWAADRSAPEGSTVAALDGGLGDPAQLHTIDFGDNCWSLSRQSIAGDKQKAVERLRAACRKVLRTNPAPPSKAPTPGENKFIAFLAGSKPVDQQPGKWRLYELNEPVAMAAGIADATPHARDNGGARSKAVAEGGRVVVWAVAMPALENQWTLCTFQSSKPTNGEDHTLADAPIPPEGVRLLALSAADGGKIVTFAGPNRPGEWKGFYDGWFARQGWEPVGGWQPIGAAWYAKFAMPGQRGAVELRFGPDGRDGLSGLMLLSPGKPR